MSQILDDINAESKPTKTFSKLSFAVAVGSVILLVLLLRQIPSKIEAREGLPEPPMILVGAIIVFVLTGAAMTILSCYKKEPATWMKWIGGVINCVLFLAVLGSILFAWLIDSGQ